MNKQTEALNNAQEVPLMERLRKVPKDARLIIDDADGMSSSVYPVGFLCHQAAEALEQPAQEPVAFIQAGDLVWSSKQLHKGLTEEMMNDKLALYLHPATSWQGLKRDDVIPILEKHGYEFTSTLYYLLDDFEQALKEKNER